jgi:hypothetical protein
MNLKQIKFVNGEEIICELVEEYEEEIVVKNALKLSKVETSTYVTYYNFRPWMTMKNDVSDIILVNAYHMICAANPSDELGQQYIAALKSFYEDNDEEIEDDLETEGFFDSATNVVSFLKPKLH